METLKNKIQEDCQSMIEKMEHQVQKGDSILLFAREAVLLETLSDAADELDYFYAKETEKLMNVPDIAFAFLQSYNQYEGDIDICNKKDVLFLLHFCAENL